VYNSEMAERVLALFEAGVLIPMCAWCERINLDDEWLRPPRLALAAIDVPNALSHTICPSCAAEQTGQISS
jgi:hypothetical protein